ncbi:MAG: hypothetical protein NUV80_00945 [Candidatus Berkelbacteria bacterium]|nr:hypothetical protein [Candidatus Berkelbacteria bacterium]
MSLCLPKFNREKLAKALKGGDISLAKLYAMSDAERNVIFKQYVGADFAAFVNAKFEQAMLSNQKKALANWITRTISRSDPIRRDMLKKVEKIQRFLSPDEESGFLKDLAELKLGMNVTEEEAQTILKLKDKIDEFKVKIPVDAPKRSAERLAYGFALDDFKQFVGGLKKGAESLTLMERFRPASYWQDIIDIAGITKSLVATLDNSFIGRQGIKTLLAGKYRVWGTAVIASFRNFAKELFAKHPGFFKSRSDAVMASIRADVYSRPNALNGKYKAAKNGYGLGVLHEEVFPTSIPERIPLLGRVFKASETAFSGSALRMRADLADAMIASAEKNGVDMADEAQATAFGQLVTSMTGRGELGKLAVVGRELNVLMFSVRFLKSNFDTLTAHLFDRSFTPEARKVAALSTLRIGASIMALLSVAKLLDPDSVDFDPRSSAFGQIKVFGHRFDITGGMRGLVTLGSRIVPTSHNGEWGFWTKSASTGKYTRMGQGEFGEQTALDTIEGFFEGKLSPTAGAVRDILKGQNFEGQKPGILNTVTGLITPISADMLVDELKKGNDDVLLAMIAEGLGISATETTFRGFGKKWEQLKEKKGDRVYNEALKQITERFNERAKKLRESSRYQNMNNEKQAKELDSIRTEETEKIFQRYGL